METLKITRFKSLKSTSPESVVDLSEVIQDIRSDKYRKEIEVIRNGNLSKKDLLPVFTPTGIFNHRSIKGLQEYNGIVCLDIDHVEKPELLKDKVRSIPWVFVAFVTPSGKGLKVMVKTNATITTFKNIEMQVAEEFHQATGFVRDNRCKDIARIQFVSYDPNIYVNFHSKVKEYGNKKI